MALKHDGHWAVVVAVACARVMQMSVDHEVDVVSVRERMMSAADAMLVVERVSTARVRRRAGVGIRFAHLDRVLVDMAFVSVMKVTVVCVVLVPLVADHRVTATGAVDVRMNLMRLVRAHGRRLRARIAPELASSLGELHRLANSTPGKVDEAAIDVRAQELHLDRFADVESLEPPNHLSFDGGTRNPHPRAFLR
jgi:hypothetical protein